MLVGMCLMKKLSEKARWPAVILTANKQLIPKDIYSYSQKSSLIPWNPLLCCSQAFGVTGAISQPFE